MPTRSYEQLTFRDDFMFCKVLQNNPKLCKELLELILGESVGNLIEITQQETIRITSNRKGVRFDVYARDDRSVVYDVEMQNANEGNLPKRARYSQSLMDLDQLELGILFVIYVQKIAVWPCRTEQKRSFFVRKELLTICQRR